MDGQFEMRERLLELIEAEREHGVLPSWLHDNALRILAEHLLAGGVMMPPVKLGQTVYAVLYGFCDAEIQPWKVCGVSFVNGEWFAVEYDGSEFPVGSELCLLSLQEAESLKKQIDKGETENATDAKEAG